VIDLIGKLYGIAVKPAIFLFRYFREEPKITVTMEGSGCAQGASHLAGRIHFHWWRTLILHNDSAHLVRGIKLLQAFPKPWRFNKDIPTRLAPDEKVRIPIEAELEEDHQAQIDRFGPNMQHRLAEAVFPQFNTNTSVEFQLTNEQGQLSISTRVFLKTAASNQ
jgi:hypothetical protein